MSEPTHCQNNTLDLIRSYGINVNGVEILQLSDDISDHYLVLCKLHITKMVNSTPCYKYVMTITSTTKDCFVRHLSDLSQFLRISNSSEKTMMQQKLWTIDMVAPSCLRKIKKNRLTPWYNEHTRALKRKTKLEVFCIAWWESTLYYRKPLKTARSDYFTSLLE